MTSQIFISLPVADLEKSANFYSKMGFTFNPQMSEEDGKCFAWSDTIFVMILTHDKFKTFTDKPIMDPKTMVSAGYTLSVESLEKMNEVVNNGLAAGGTEPNEVKDYGFMKERSIEDPDGYNWGIIYMDASKAPAEH